MSYTALYRKFRPQTFADVKGQDHIVTTLKNQVISERLGHAYLFCGTRGTGKTTIAKILARMANCEHPTENGPCCECESCKSIAEGKNMNVVEMDAASNNGVESIREIIEEVSYSPVNGKYKVYIIDEVHMLSPGAFNALLKTLEEPPSYVIFILATTEVHRIPITILSRCQRYDFKRISIETIADRLKELTEIEKLDSEDRALSYIAKVADGSMRDALSLLDQCVAFNFGQKLTFDKALEILGAVDTGVFSKMLRLVVDNNIIGLIELLEDIVMQGRELGQFVSDFTWYLRNLMLIKSCADGFAENILDISSEHMKLIKEEADMLELDTIFRYINVFSELSGRLKYATQKRITVEMALIKLCRPQMESDEISLKKRVEDVEKKLESGIMVQAMPAMSSGNLPAAPDNQVVKASYEAPIPEDIKTLVREWNHVVELAEQPLATYINKADHDIMEDGTLIIYVDDKIKAGKINEPDRKTELERILSEYIQRDVHIEAKHYKKEYSKESQFNSLQSRIGMTITVEE